MLLFWRKRRFLIERVRLDAEMLLESYGRGAYEEARTRARDARLSREDQHDDVPPGHWDTVRRFIGKRTARNFVDTATRYLDP